MAYNLYNKANSIALSTSCIYDNVVGYKSNFNYEGDVDGWDDYYGIHTYGCSNGFIFGTVYYKGAYIGRTNIFKPLDCRYYYVLKLSIKLSSVNIEATINGKFMWRTINDPIWDDKKSITITLSNELTWIDYYFNMGDVHSWQGDVNDLRFLPMVDCNYGDEFYIKNISIESLDKRVCLNEACSYYNSFSTPCQGSGLNGSITTSINSIKIFELEQDVNDLLIINIDGYGYENINIGNFIGSGKELAILLRDKISEVDVGGYFDCNVVYDVDRFIIYSGTKNCDSGIDIISNSFSKYINLYDYYDIFIGKKSSGELPANGFIPNSTFIIPSSKIINLFKDKDSYIEFDPSLYMVEAGRNDWLLSGTGTVGTSGSSFMFDMSSIATLSLDNKVGVDLCHPFNASGKINKIYIQGTTRKSDFGPDEFYNAPKVYVFRPLLNGKLRLIHTLDIPARIDDSSILYSSKQEHISIECNIIVNKGDLLGLYDLRVYVGKSMEDNCVDALYYLIDGKPSTGEITPGHVLGEGSSGLLLYARGDIKQTKLSIDIDMGDRINLESVDVSMSYDSAILDYNIARCLDIDWSITMFGATHHTGYTYANDTTSIYIQNDFIHDNKAYGISKLNDGIKITSNSGKAAKSYTSSHADGIDVIEPEYFFVNGDGEWVSSHQHIGTHNEDIYANQFNEDPICFDIIFPFGSYKKIHKSAVYFKENNNFRTFSLQYYMDETDDEYIKIPKYNSVSLDGTPYLSDNPMGMLYLHTNPSNGQIIENEPGVVANNDQNLQSMQLDWTVLEHEFDPIDCRGFRFRTDYHKSTKVTEMELYCYVDASSDNVLSTVSCEFSSYADDWYKANIKNSDNGVSAFIGATPRHISLTIEPFRTIRISKIDFNLSDGSIFLGDGGCEDTLYLKDNKLNTLNDSNKLSLKNIYKGNSNLSIDIPNEVVSDKSGLILCSTMDTKESIIRPLVGSDCTLKIKDDYKLLDQTYNCAVNCFTYSLINSIDNKHAYMSYNNVDWNDIGYLKHDAPIDFHNIPMSSVTILEIPDHKRSRYWKIACASPELALNVREIYILRGNERVECIFYYDYDTKIENSIHKMAYHLGNNNLSGSYYILKNDNYIGFETEEMDYISKIIIYHDKIDTYYKDSVGIDEYTNFMLRIKNKFMSTSLYDYSYNELDFIDCNNVYANKNGNYIDYHYEDTMDLNNDWQILSDFSNFTSVSGVVNVEAACHYSIDDKVIKRLELGRPIFKEHNFNFRFKINVSSASINDNGICIGITDGEGHYYLASAYACDSIFGWYKGIQLILWNKEFYFICHYNYSKYTVNKLDGTYEYDIDYFCELSSIGNEAYTVNVWSNAWETTLITTFTCDWTADWIGTHLCIGSTGGPSGECVDNDPDITIDMHCTISEMVINSSIFTDKDRYDNRSIQINGDGSYIEFENNDCLNTYNKSVIVDFFILFDSLPEEDEYCYICKYIDGDPLANNSSGDGWYIYFINDSNKFYIRAKRTKDNGAILSTLFNADFSKVILNKWYHIYIELTSGYVSTVYIDNLKIVDMVYSLNFTTGTCNTNFIIGEGIHGSIYDLRISMTKDSAYINIRDNYIPTYNYERLYNFNLYSSDDNIIFGKYASLEAKYYTKHSHFNIKNKYSENYLSYIIIDLEKRHKIDFLRNYSGTNLIDWSLENNIIFSGDDNDNIYNINITDNEYNYFNRDDVSYCSGSFYFDTFLFLSGNYTITSKNIDTAWIDFELEDKRLINKLSYDSSGAIQISSAILILEASNDINPYWDLKDWSTIIYTDDKLIGLNQSLIEISNIDIDTEFKYYRFKLTNLNNKSFYINNLNIFSYVTSNSWIRWIGIKFLNGDNILKSVGKLGVYTDISTVYSDSGGYNNSWLPIGNALTNYGEDNNVAYNKKVLTSSQFFNFSGDALVDNYIGNEMHECWGSDSDSSQFIVISLDNIYKIYRIKIYHNYTDANSDFIATSYQLLGSIDNIEYFNILNISGNTKTIRTHDLSEPVEIKYFKINITGYKSNNTYINYSNKKSYFNGVFFRQIQLFEYSGHSVLNNEYSPVICMNLRDHFYIDSFKQIGIDFEDTSYDWVIDGVTYSSYSIDDPNKISFRRWQNSVSGYDKWIAIKNIGATDYNQGVQFIKQLEVYNSTLLNMCDYHWWWNSSISDINTVCASLDKPYSLRSLNINYPESYDIEHISNLESGTLGIDVKSMWRDGLSFYMYISDIDNIDKDFGYFYLKGYDYTTNHYAIEHRWNIATFKDSITTGWNYCFFRFKKADSIIYTENDDVVKDVRLPNTIEFKQVGLLFKGVGNKLNLKFNGFDIERNRTHDMSMFGRPGFYMSYRDIIFYKLSKFNIYSGTIEMWIRPDYDGNGLDNYGQHLFRTLFNINNNSNDIFGAMITYKGICVYFGNTTYGVDVAYLKDELGSLKIDDNYHMAFVFSCNGKGTSDGSTIKIYINNRLIGKSYSTWKVSDNKKFNFTLGGQGCMSVKASLDLPAEAHSLDAVVSNLKIYDYCKENFSLENNEEEINRIGKNINIIEISKNDKDFFSVGDPMLPLVYKNIKPEEEVFAYVRSNMPDNVSSLDNRSTNLLIAWDVTI